MNALRILGFASCFFLCSQTTLAQQNDSAEGLFTLVLENDYFGERKEDRNYSNGFQLTWMSQSRSTPEWARRWAAWGDRFAGIDIALNDVRIEYQIGQTIFTPKELERFPPDPRDRPYAGLLYGSFGIVGRRFDNSFEQLQLLVGVVGPSSRAKEVQRIFHRLIAVDDPKGWDTQISDRFAYELRFQRTESPLRREGFKGLTTEIATHYGVALGNLNASVNTGVGVRIGMNLPDDFGPPRISPSLPGSGYFRATADTGWYLFGGIDGRYVHKNLVLDAKSSLGNGVTRLNWGADIQYGLAYYRRNLRIAYTVISRSKEFKEQDTKLSSFGAFSITWAN
jgi:lipid A 3-O-deacylase